jgi:hypothetical protein
VTLSLDYHILLPSNKKHNEPTADYIRRFRDTRNQCFNLNISNKYLTDLAYSRLSPHLKEIVKAEPKSLEAFLGVVSLGTSVMLIWWSIVVSHQTTKRPICV